MKKISIVLIGLTCFLVATSLGALSASPSKVNRSSPSPQKTSLTENQQVPKKEKIIEQQVIQKQIIQAFPETKGADLSVTTTGTAGNATIQIHSSSREKAQYLADLIQRIYPSCTITIIL